MLKVYGDLHRIRSLLSQETKPILWMTLDIELYQLMIIFWLYPLPILQSQFLLHTGNLDQRQR